MEICVCAAVKTTDGEVVQGRRHADCIEKIYRLGKRCSNEQGFITSTSRYVSRSEGRKLQDAAGIPSACRDGYMGNTLYSEDLY